MGTVPAYPVPAYPSDDEIAEALKTLPAIPN